MRIAHDALVVLWWVTCHGKQGMRGMHINIKMIQDTSNGPDRMLDGDYQDGEEVRDDDVNGDNNGRRMHPLMENMFPIKSNQMHLLWLPHHSPVYHNQ